MGKKLTDEEIVKALEVCNTVSMSCDDCPFNTNSEACEGCGMLALDLIHRLQGEIERLKEERDVYLDDCSAVRHKIRHEIEEKFELQKQVDEYKYKIEQGTLIELPCKVGDTIWCIEGFCDDSFDIIEKVVGYLVVFANSIDIHASKPISSGLTRAYDTRKIGKTVFLTREEAEKRLLELQGDK